VTASQLATAAAAFVGTTVDDLIILAVLFMVRRGTGSPSARVIIGGQYAGTVVILAVALATAAGLRSVPDQWVGLLGLVPIGFGAWGLWRLRGNGTDSRAPLASTFTRIATITFANGADTISVFAPLFRTLRTGGPLLATALFLALTGVWCVAGVVLGNNLAAVTALGRVTQWVAPIVFIAVGVFILIATGTVAAVGQAL
jgi:cadmium resistance protein CadD (predicted permease)